MGQTRRAARLIWSPVHFPHGEPCNLALGVTAAWLTHAGGLPIRGWVGCRESYRKTILAPDRTNILQIGGNVNLQCPPLKPGMFHSSLQPHFTSPMHFQASIMLMIIRYRDHACTCSAAYQNILYAVPLWIITHYWP